MTRTSTKHPSSRLLTAVNKACAIIEAADARLLACDGPVNGLPPDMTLAEWKDLYKTLDRARKPSRGAV